MTDSDEQQSILRSKVNIYCEARLADSDDRHPPHGKRKRIYLTGFRRARDGWHRINDRSGEKIQFIRTERGPVFRTAIDSKGRSVTIVDDMGLRDRQPLTCPICSYRVRLRNETLDAMLDEAAFSGVSALTLQELAANIRK